MRKELIADSYDFEYLIQSGVFYADKTNFLHQLVCSKRQTYFLSRPRRFGKSLTLSTLKCIFEGKKHLFEGLKIADLYYDWRVYPVIHLNMSKLDTSNGAMFIEEIKIELESISKNLNLEFVNASSVGTQFADLIVKVAESSALKQCVLLIDEYDYPLIENIDKPHLQEVRTILENFFIQIKANNEKLRFTFMTGVTRFSRISVFSKLNHLLDITFSEQFATMLGYTQEELEYYFEPWFSEFAAKAKIPYKLYLEKVKLWYNGFKFSPEGASVYNPVSIALFIINDGRFSNYWFNTGSTSFMPKMVIKYDNFVIGLIEGEFDADKLNSFDVTDIDLRALMVQTGYLTIKNTEFFGNKTLCQLDYPNIEVKSSFNTHLLPLLASIHSDNSDASILKICRALQKCELEKVVSELKSFLASIPYTTFDKDNNLVIEDYFRNILFVIFKILGAQIQAEYITNNGRIDTIMETDKYIYIFEYKMNKTAKAAIEQIQANGYADMFRTSTKQVYLIGFNFDSTIKNINEYSIISYTDYIKKSK